MADLSTLDGISHARNDLYNELSNGKVTEVRAAQQERLLRGQESLLAHVPIRLLNVVTKFKGGQTEKYAGALVMALLKFTTGQVPESLTAADLPEPKAQLTGKKSA